jgi:hypothetical protein
VWLWKVGFVVDEDVDDEYLKLRISDVREAARMQLVIADIREAAGRLPAAQQ